MKLVKWAFFSVVGLVVLAIAGIGIAMSVIDGAFVKARAERYMKDEKQRTLQIVGTPTLTLFPVFRLVLGKTTLSEPKSDKVFVSLESMDVAVRVMPLLSGTLAIETLTLAGLNANVMKDNTGRMNFADLAGDHAKASNDADDHDGSPPNVSIAGVNIDRAALTYTDVASGQVVSVGEFNLKTGRLDENTPAPVSLSVQVGGRKPAIDMKAKLVGEARFNLKRKIFSISKLDARVLGNAATLRGLDVHARGNLSADAAAQTYSVEGFSVEVKGTLERDQLSASVSAPAISITPQKASGQAVKATVRIKGPKRNVDAKLDIAAVDGTAAALSIPSLKIELDAAAEGNSVKGSIATPLQANLKDRVLDLPKIIARMTITSPAIPQKAVTLPIEASLRLDAGKGSGNGQVQTKFDGSTIRAKFGATKLEPLVANFDVAIDQLNLDRYLPKDSTSGKAKADAPIDLSPLKGPTVSGKIEIGRLQAKGVKLEKLHAEVKLAGGRLDIAPYSANLYGGTLGGTVSADANGNRIAVKENVKNVDLGPLLRDAAKKDVLEGRGDVTLEITAAGGTVSALKRALAGNAKVTVREGAVKGVNLADSFRNIKSVMGSKSSKPDMSKKTDFSEMGASFVIKNGVARNDDLSAKSPFLRLTGAGNIDIGNNSLDYLAKAALVATSKGSGGADTSKLAGVTVPVKLTGSLDAPDWNIDYSALISAGGLGKVTEKLGGAVGGAVRGLLGGDKPKEGEKKPEGGGLGGKLKGLFGR
ncbi:MAG: AsmA family protein [Proteobacteria bacterium]|nr:AsmA family protein [Pseudomonadota bacterium]